MSVSRSSMTKQNLLFPIQLGNENHDGKYVSNLLQKTKSLVLSDQNYNKFMKKYLIMTQQCSFKLPEITNYPILKNESLIPINRQTYSSGSQFVSKNKNVKKKENFILSGLENNETSRLKSAGFTTMKVDKTSNGFLPQILEGHVNSSNHLPVKIETQKDTRQPLIENFLIPKNVEAKNSTMNTIDNNNIYINIEKAKNLKNKKLLSENEMKIKSIIRSHSSSTNKLFDKKSTLRSISDIDIPKDYSNRNLYVSNDYKSLILDLLIDFEFNNKIFNYDEMIKNKYCFKSTALDEIKKAKILERLRNFINNLILGKNENLTSELKKSYEILDEKIIELKISSLELEFIPNDSINIVNPKSSSNYFSFESKKDFVYDSHNNMSLKNYDKDKIQRIKIPFSLMPILYYCKLETFYTILAKIITVNEYFYKSNKDPNYPNDKEIEECPQEEGILGENENNENEPTPNRQEIRIDFETVKKVLETHKDFIFDNEDYNKDFTNLKTLEWISDSKRYTIRIHPPKIEFYLADNSFNISKNVPKELLIFLINKSFINWDFFVLNFISRFKLFRDNLNERFYKKMKQPKVKSPRYTQESFYGARSMVMDDLSNNFIALSLDEQISEPDTKNLNSRYFFFTSANGDTNFFVFNSYELIISLKTQEIIKTVKNQSIEEKINYENKEYNFKFNMDQLIKLQKLKMFYDIKDYLKRMVAIQKKNSNNNGYTKILKIKNESINSLKVDFDLKYFENLDDNFFKFLVKSDPLKITNQVEESIPTLYNEEKEESSINYKLK